MNKCNKFEIAGNTCTNKDVISYSKMCGTQNFTQDAYLDAAVITAFRNDDTIRSQQGRVMDTPSIWDLTPYKE